MNDWHSFSVEGLAARAPCGPIYRAQDRSTGQRAWLYTLEQGLPTADPRVEEFHRRRRLAAILGSHPHIWSFLEDGGSHALPYYAVVEPLGRPLVVHMAHRPPGQQHPVEVGEVASHVPGRALAPPWVIRGWMADLCSGVDFAHQAGVVLGNLSPHTIWIAGDGRAMLMDPGAPGGSRNGPWLLEYVDPSLTAPAPGPVAFLAPEQLLGWPVGPRADIYALGAILFWLLGGSFPSARAVDAARIGRYLPLRALEEPQDAALSAIYRRATAIQSAGRFATAELLRAELLAVPDDRTHAAHRAATASRRTLIQGLSPTSSGASDRALASSTSARFLRWLQGR